MDRANDHIEWPRAIFSRTREKRQNGTVPPTCGGGASSLLCREEGGAMVTYGDLFAYSLVIIGIIGLCMQFRNKKK